MRYIRQIETTPETKETKCSDDNFVTDGPANETNYIELMLSENLVE
jgi:hypothetical protein